MSVGPYAGAVQRVSADTNLAELFRRVDALERSKQSGDYVFIEEIVVPETDDIPIVFSDITQEFEHLQIKARLASYSGSPDLIIALTASLDDGVSYMSASNYLQNLSNPTVPVGENDVIAGSTTGIVARGALVNSSAVIGGDSALGVLFAHVQIEIPFYSRDDAVAMCSWQSTALMTFGDDDGDPAVTLSMGGGYARVPGLVGAAVTDVVLDGGDYNGGHSTSGGDHFDYTGGGGGIGSGLAVGSRASLYGIRGGT